MRITWYLALDSVLTYLCRAFLGQDLRNALLRQCYLNVNLDDIFTIPEMPKLENIFVQQGRYTVLADTIRQKLPPLDNFRELWDDKHISENHSTCPPALG